MDNFTVVQRLAFTQMEVELQTSAIRKQLPSLNEFPKYNLRNVANLSKHSWWTIAEQTCWHDIVGMHDPRGEVDSKGMRRKLQLFGMIRAMH